MPARTTTQRLPENGTNSFRCRVCRGVHALRKCRTFMRLTAEKRLRAVLVNKYCPNCLAHQHSGRSCRSRGSCKICHKDHHTLLHFKESRNSRQPRPTKKHGQTRPRSRSPSSHRSRPSVTRRQSPATPASNVMTTSLTSLLQHKALSILPTAGIVLNNGVKDFEMRALIDPCSPTSRISASLANAFGLSVTRVGAEGVCTAVIRSKTTDLNREVLLQVDSQLCVRTPLRRIERDLHDHFKSVTLADDQWFRPGTVFLLLGADVYPHIILPGVLPSTNGLPMAQNSVFGWILSGTCGQ